ncbi:MAG: hypothetical protein P8O06_05320 [Porticoccaceae bacterium]|nr:hypothetical protein [Porticoccaceae bacterium]
MDIKSFSKQIVDKANGFAISRVGFWSSISGSVDIVERSDQGARSALLSQKTVMIIGREGYFESVKEYPVADRKDLSKIIRNEKWSFPYRGVRFVNIIRISSQAHRVFSWVVKQEIIDGLPDSCWLIVPETACVKALDFASDIVLESDNRKLWVKADPNGLVSTINLSEKQIEHSQQQEVSNFFPPEFDVQDLNTKLHYTSTILRGLKKVCMTSPWDFIVPQKKQLAFEFPWLNATKILSSVAFIYLAMSSAFLLLQDQWLDRSIERREKSAETALEVQQQLTTESRSLEIYNQLASAAVPIWMFWEIFLDLHEQDVQFLSIKSNDTAKIAVFVRAPKASDILASLLQNPRINKAEYVSAVSNQGDLQQFGIEITLNTEFISQQAGVVDDE